MRTYFLAALGVSALALTPLWLASGCAAGNENPGTTNSGGAHSTGGSGGTTSGGSGGTAGTAGKGGTGGSLGGGGTGGAIGGGGTGGTGGAGGSVCVPSDEVCDGVDNNCDGVADEGCLCKLGDTQSCYTGDPVTINIGECLGGTSTCDITGTWGPCTGEVVPTAELCDGKDNDCNGTKDDGLGTTTCGVGACQVTVDNCVDNLPQTCTPGEPVAEKCNGLDDNCDSVVDEGCVCLDGSQQSCYTGPPSTLGVGECKPGTQHCQGGQWGPCQNEIVPAPEECNAKDDDCDGNADEGLGTSVCGLGTCQVVSPNCVGGIPQTCVPGLPDAEVCDGEDNDCNGTVDDGLGTISCGLGACVNTVPFCKNGLPNVCNPLPPTSEVCDGVDNNCNGAVDDGDPGGGGACNTGLSGVCAAGIQHCLGGSIQCVQSTQPSAEICDGNDNDCNGTVDDGNPGSGSPCLTGLQGVCSAGTTTCAGGAISCAQNTQPSPEVCDGFDNNCNGGVDEGNPGGGLACNTGLLGACAAGATACASGQVVCNQTTPPTAESCDGIDNNCNGGVDEGNPGGGLACTTGLPGICSAGTTACSNGTTVCNQNQQPTTEVCNGLDDNCSGAADEGNPGGGVACVTGQLGVCSPGTTACTGGAVVCNRNVNPAAETCDGLDNDCNGLVDDGVKLTFYRDADGDGFGDPGNFTQACTAPAGFVANNGDCNDGNAAVKPGATEVCNGIDDNCVNGVDEGVKTTWYADADGDGFGNPAVTTQACAQPAGFVANSADCNDGNNAVKPGATEVCNGVDDNCSGSADEGNPGGGVACSTGQLGVCAAGTTACTGGALACNRNQNPSAESCDGLDNDCNGLVDEGVKTTYYADADGDGFGDPGSATQACAQPAGYVTNAADCNDGSAAVKPGATEVCNGIDDNCVNGVDEGVKTTYYADADGDGFGNLAVTTQACSPPSGYVSNATDCNDSNSAVKPGAVEVCNGVDDDCSGNADEGNPGGGMPCSTGQLGVCAAGTTACTGGALACNRNQNPSAEVCDGLDNDCNGLVDEGVKTTYYADADGDTHGDPGNATQACAQPAGYVTSATDCDDGNGAVHPGATEVCNGIDDNCANGVDEGVKTTYYRDADGDGYGNPSVTTQACSQPAGYVTNDDDCNDGNGAIKPGATEVCNGVDDDCDGSIDEGVKTTYYADADGDGFGNPSVTTQACSQPAGHVTNNGDCNDGNNAVKPGAAELCNGVDDDCDGGTDEGNPGGGVACSTGQLGVCAPGTTACTGGALVCNRNVNPSAEVCDGLDNDCNGSTDEGVLTTYYRDADGDTFGNPSVTTQACSQPSGYVTNNADCNDGNGAVRPGATEICNGVDDNCNGSTDEGNPGGGVSCSTGQPGICAPGTTACTGGSLVCNRNSNPTAETCNSLDDNCDGQTDNNAIVADGMPNSCTLATNKTVAVAPGGFQTVSGYIDPNGDDWFVVNFTGVPGPGGYYHPRVWFSSNPSSQFKLRVFSACGTVAAGCTGNLDTFEMYYPSNPSACVSHGNCTDNTPKTSSFIVQVTRVAGAPFTCTPYTVRVDNL